MDRPTARSERHLDESVTSWFLYFGRKGARDSTPIARRSTSFPKRVIGGPPINANVRPFRDARIIPFPSIARKIDETKLSPRFHLCSATFHDLWSGLACPQGRVRRIYSTGNASSSYLLGRGEDEPTPANSPLESKHATLTAEKGMNNTRARGEPDRVLSISRRFSGIVPRSGTVGGTRTRTTSLHRLRWIHDEVQRTCSSMRSFRFPPASLDIPRIWTGSFLPPSINSYNSVAPDSLASTTSFHQLFIACVYYRIGTAVSRWNWSAAFFVRLPFRSVPRENNREKEEERLIAYRPFVSKVGRARDPPRFVPR